MTALCEPSTRDAVRAPNRAELTGDLLLPLTFTCRETSSPLQSVFTKETQTGSGKFSDKSTDKASGQKNEKPHGLCLNDKAFTYPGAKGWSISTQLILTWRYPKEKAGGQRQKAFLFTCLSLIRKEWKFFPRNLKNSILYISLDEIGSNVHPVSKEEEGLVVGEATRSICSITYLHMVFYSYAYVVDNVPNYEQQKMFLTDLTRKWLYS